jgi:hypothetical protein
MVKNPFTGYPQARKAYCDTIRDARTAIALFYFVNDDENDGYYRAEDRRVQYHPDDVEPRPPQRESREKLDISAAHGSEPECDREQNKHYCCRQQMNTDFAE